MKALTIIQPWATLLASGKKRCETRSWKTNYRGEILIHAGKKDPLWGISMMTDDAWEKVLFAFGLYDDFNRFEKFPPGAIIGKANLVNCVLIDRLTAELIFKQHPEEFAFGNFTPGRYAWVMEDAVLFDKPILASGKQGLWNWEGELL
ncbi:MAG: ASCH domain-containing protein [bacterium]|nr:ASCH domain-containing protein [bacterium]MCM1542655.1 ASCH domain-containing protein [Blautia sp.]